MKLNLALAVVAAIAIDAATASTCTKSDLEFLTMSPGTDCTFRPASVAYLAAIDPSLSLTTLAGGLDTATDTIQKSAVVLGYCNGALKNLAPSATVNCTDQVLNTQAWQNVITAAPTSTPIAKMVATINATRLLVIANVTCIAIKQTMGALLPCFSKNCTAVALSFCNGNPNAMASSTTVGQIATAAFGALTQACGAILTTAASDDSDKQLLFGGLFPTYNAQTYSVNCSTLLDPSQFGTFTYNTSTPTKPSSASTASIGVATLASVVAAAFAF